MLFRYKEHLDDVKRGLTTLESSQAFGFGAACVEREWPIYERAAQARSWSQAQALRRTLDEIWAWLLRQRGRPRGLARVCEGAILVEIEDDTANAASEVATSFFALASIIEDDQKDQVLYAAKANLSFIEAYVSEMLDIVPTPENAAKIDSHELMQAEMGRQREDLDVLARATPLPSVIEQVRARSQGVSILDSYWFA
jgi:hypothetical protein